MNFIDKASSLIYTEQQIQKRLAKLERARFSARDEEILARIASGTALGMYTPTAEEQALMAEFNTFMADMVALGAEVRADNQFVAQKVAYIKATDRLAQYVLSEGRAAIYEEQPTGEYDENGDPIMGTVLVSEAIDPLPATVEQPVYDPETGEQTGTEEVPNPAIVQDVAEREAAQAVIDATPQEVIDYVLAQDAE